MRPLPLLLAALACSGVAACAAPAQLASNDSCRQFALSGGYPFLSGGPIGGPSSDMEQLPGEPPLMLDSWDRNGIANHIAEEDYLENWCLKNPALNVPH
jgi:hypothetical protein